MAGTNKNRNFINLIRKSEGKENRVSHMLGVISSVGNKILNSQTYSGGEVRSLKVMLPFGISSSPMKGMQTQVIINDNNNNTAIGVNDESRPNVGIGEVMLYNRHGCKIHLKNDGSITMMNGNASIEMSSDGININGNVRINGNPI